MTAIFSTRRSGLVRPSWRLRVAGYRQREEQWSLDRWRLRVHSANRLGRHVPAVDPPRVWPRPQLLTFDEYLSKSQSAGLVSMFHGVSACWETVSIRPIPMTAAPSEACRHATPLSALRGSGIVQATGKGKGGGCRPLPTQVKAWEGGGGGSGFGTAGEVEVPGVCNNAAETRMWTSLCSRLLVLRGEYPRLGRTLGGAGPPARPCRLFCRRRCV